MEPLVDCSLGIFFSQIEVNIPPTSNIKNAFLIFYQLRYEDNEYNEFYEIDFNNYHINVKHNDFITSYKVKNSNSIIYNSKLHVINVTDFVSSQQNFYPIHVESDITQDSRISCYYLVVIYESNNLLLSNCKIFLNDKDLVDKSSFFNFNINNPILNSFDVGLSIQSDIVASGGLDDTDVIINNNNIGVIAGNDFNDINPSAGVKGSFFYENGILNGLIDDTADPFMSGSDGLAKINSYINGNNINLELKIANSFNLFNNYISFPIVYTTPCDTFSVSTPSDTSICQGTQLQLNASTSNPNAVYEWDSPNPNALADLSCVNCPNPIFSGDSTRFYTVRIWNTDSCSVVRPVRISVLPKPVFQNLQVTNSSCFSPSGAIQLSASQGTAFSLDTFNWQSSGNFSQLNSGNYQLFLQDSNGCVNDTLVSINSINDLSASFTANPQNGAAPLTVNLQNSSQNASNFDWHVFSNNAIDSSQNSSFGPLTFDSSGVYNVQLIAYNFDSTCVDTFALNILVYDSLMVQIPNVFTPNGDGVNDVFSINTNIPVYCEMQIFNRWGNEMHSFAGNLVAGTNVLWAPPPLSPSEGGISSGTYFYKFSLKTEQQTLEKEGFVQVVR